MITEGCVTGALKPSYRPSGSTRIRSRSISLHLYAKFECEWRKDNSKASPYRFPSSCLNQIMVIVYCNILLKNEILAQTSWLVDSLQCHISLQIRKAYVVHFTHWQRLSFENNCKNSLASHIHQSYFRVVHMNSPSSTTVLFLCMWFRRLLAIIY